MDSKKKPKSIISTTDELALVKAAAMAWYHHGSGAEAKLIREIDLMRTCSAPRPSRYKLEALRIAHEDDETEGSQSQTPSPIHTDNSLLDKYEIESISKQLDHYIQSSGNKFLKGVLVSDQSYHKNVSSKSDVSSGMTNEKNKILKRFWLTNVAVCGRREDVNPKAFRRQPATGKPSFH